MTTWLSAATTLLGSDVEDEDRHVESEVASDRACLAGCDDRVMCVSDARGRSADLSEGAGETARGSGSHCSSAARTAVSPSSIAARICAA